MKNTKQFVDPDSTLGYYINALLVEFNEGKRFLSKCTKPQVKELHGMLWMCITGMTLMGILAFVVKIIFVPVNNIIFGSSRV